MIISFVAVLAAEVVSITGHMYVNITGWVSNTAVQVTVLYRITAAAEEVTVTTVLTGCLADIAGNVEQVNGWVRHASAGRGFLILASCVMTHQAINFTFVFKIEAGRLPAIANMTTRTTRPVSFYGDSKIIERINLTAVGLLTSNRLLG